LGSLPLDALRSTQFEQYPPVCRAPPDHGFGMFRSVRSGGQQRSERQNRPAEKPLRSDGHEVSAV